METKIPFYNVTNIFLLGILVISSIIYVYNTDIWAFILYYNRRGPHISTFVQSLLFLFSLGIIYEVGLIVNRISSIVFEFLLKKINLIPRFDKSYYIFNQAKKEYPMLSTLSREYAVSRGHVCVWTLLAIFFMIHQRWILCLSSVILAFLFFCSMRKFSLKIETITSNYKNETK